MVQELVEALKKEGVIDSEGALTIDLVRAEKILSEAKANTSGEGLTQKKALSLRDKLRKKIKKKAQGADQARERRMKKRIDRHLRRFYRRLWWAKWRGYRYVKLSISDLDARARVYKELETLGLHVESMNWKNGTNGSEYFWEPGCHGSKFRTVIRVDLLQ